MKFRIKACSDDSNFVVQIKRLGFYWLSGFFFTSYFGVMYDSKEAALAAIEGYKNRYTEVK